MMFFDINFFPFQTFSSCPIVFADHVEFRFLWKVAICSLLVLRELTEQGVKDDWFIDRWNLNFVCGWAVAVFLVRFDTCRVRIRKMVHLFVSVVPGKVTVFVWIIYHRFHRRLSYGVRSSRKTCLILYMCCDRFSERETGHLCLMSLEISSFYTCQDRLREQRTEHFYFASQLP